MQADNKKIATNTIALYIRMAITMAVSFLAVRVTLQVLGSEDYSLNNLIGSIVAMFSFINGKQSILAGLCALIYMLLLYSEPNKERNEQQERRRVLFPNGTTIQE